MSVRGKIKVASVFREAERAFVKVVLTEGKRAVGARVLDALEHGLTPRELLATEPIQVFIVFADAAETLGFRGVHGLHRALREAWLDVCSEAAAAAEAHVRGAYV